MFRFNRKEATGQDGIIIEILAALHDFEIDKIADIINEIYMYNCGDIPKIDPLS